MGGTRHARGSCPGLLRPAEFSEEDRQPGRTGRRTTREAASSESCLALSAQCGESGELPGVVDSEVEAEASVMYFQFDSVGDGKSWNSQETKRITTVFTGHGNSFSVLLLQCFSLCSYLYHAAFKRN